MVMNWIAAAAAAGSLSSGSPSETASARTAARDASAPVQAVVPSERARIIEIGREVRRLVVRFADVDARYVIAPSALRDLGLDDVGRADVALGLETRFDIDIDHTEAARWQTVGDVVSLVAQRWREARRSGPTVSQV